MTETVRRKRKAIVHGPASNTNDGTHKQANGIAEKIVQYASVEDFTLLKDISGYKNENLASLLGTTARTIQNKKNNGEPFDISQTERLIKLNQLFKEGNELFGNSEQFNEWLQKPSYGLDYNIPSDVIKQPGGLDKVLTELQAIKFGDTL